ncbi:MAG: hypothetical protein ACRDHZ_22695 [Ktedonobacteraceae bacterium]
MQGNEVYKWVGLWPRRLKAPTQMLVGVILFGLLCWRGVVGAESVWTDTNLFFNRSILDIIGKGLAYSAGIELIYMLFTPGPDEALEPVMLGIAAAILMVASKIEKPDWSGGLTVALLVAALVGLFAARKYLFSDDEATPAPAALPSSVAVHESAHDQPL